MDAAASRDAPEPHRLIVENARDYALLLTDREGNLRYWSPGAERILGWAAAEVLGEPASLIFSPEDRAAGVPEREMRAALERDSAADERWHMKRDGSRFFARGRMMVARDDAGRHAGFVKVLRDLTDERRAELEHDRRQALSRDRAQLLGRWFDNAPGFVALLRGPAHVFEMTNPAYERLVGRGDLIGRPAFEALPELRGQGFEALLDGVLHTGRPVSLRAAAIRVARTDGPGTDERFVDFTYEPVKEADGTVSGIVVQGFDVTEHVRSRREQVDLQATLAAVLDALPVGVIIVDARGGFVRSNSTHRAMWGVPPRTPSWEHYDQWEGRRPDTGERLQAHEWPLARALHGGEVVRNEPIEYRPFGGGPMRSMLTSAAPVRDTEGRLVGAVAAQLDVTEQRAADARLRDSEARLQAIFEAVPVGLFFAEAPAGTIVTANRQAEEILGHPVLPSPDVPAYAEYAAYFPDGRRLEAGDYPLARALAGEDHPRAELLYRRGDGRMAWIRSIGVSIRDARGDVSGALVALVDVDREHRAIDALSRRSDELAAAQLRLDLALDAANMGVWEWTPGTGQSYWSRQMFELLGLEPTPDGQASGETFLAMLHPEDRPRVEAALSMALAAFTPYEVEARVVRPSGEVRWMLGRGEAVPGERGRAARMLGVNLDITGRKRAELALLEVDRRRNEFLAMLGHELRNPLAPITNAVRLLESGRGDRDALQAAVRIVKRQSTHLARLVDDLLEVSRVTQGRIELHAAPLRLADAVSIAIETVRPAMGEQRQTLDVDVPADLELVADENRLVQIVANLLNNAVKYTPEGGHVAVRAGLEGDRVRLVVSDTGIGIEPERLHEMFELFRQGDGSLDRSRGGLGIGLHLVRRLVELHGGTIELHSAGPGRGVTATVRLPRGGPSGAVRPPQDAAGAGPLPAMRILVVDDNADAARSLAMLLQDDGHRVEVAHDGLEALAAARGLRPRAVLLDLGLPGMDGYEVARRLRDDPALADAALVAVSGYGQAADRERSAAAGFDAHLLKPVELEEIERAIAAALHARGGRPGV